MALVSTRSAGDDDVDAIASVHASAWKTAFTFLPSAFLDALTPEVVKGKWEHDLRDPGSAMFVANLGEEGVVGFLQISNDGQAEVMSLYVHPSAWRNGVGTALLALAEDRLAAAGHADARLWTAEASGQFRSFYERCGWVATGHRQTQVLARSVELHEVEYRKSL